MWLRIIAVSNRSRPEALSPYLINISVDRWSYVFPSRFEDAHDRSIRNLSAIVLLYVEASSRCPPACSTASRIRAAASSGSQCVWFGT